MRKWTRYTVNCLLVLSISIIACTNTNNKTIKQGLDSMQADTTTKSPPNINVPGNDTLIVNRQAAVFYQPDSLQIVKNKELTTGEEDFYVGAGDYLYYLSTAHHFLDSTKVPLLDAKDKQFLKFIRNNQSEQIIKLDTLPERWGIYLFDPAKEPKSIDMTIVEEEYKSYFK